MEPRLVHKTLNRIARILHKACFSLFLSLSISLSLSLSLSVASVFLHTSWPISHSRFACQYSKHPLALLCPIPLEMVHHLFDDNTHKHQGQHQHTYKIEKYTPFRVRQRSRVIRTTESRRDDKAEAFHLVARGFKFMPAEFSTTIIPSTLPSPKIKNHHPRG